MPNDVLPRAIQRNQYVQNKHTSAYVGLYLSPYRDFASRPLWEISVPPEP